MMNKDKLKQFLDGELDFDELQKTRDNSDFVSSYKKLVGQSHTPDFNPFEKIESNKKKRISIVKRVLPYAASVLLVLGSIWVFQKYNSQKTRNFSEAEIFEIQQNTEMALLHFSKELNDCMKEFEDAKYLQQPANEIKLLKEIKIDKSNPFKNIKIK